MKKQTLLEKAKTIKTGSSTASISDEEYQVLIALVKKEITSTQAYKALGLKTRSNLYSKMERAFERYVKENEKK